jgi:hypothetical protein
MEIYIQEYREPDRLVLIDVKYPYLRFVFEGLSIDKRTISVEQFYVESAIDDVEIPFNLDSHAKLLLDSFMDSKRKDNP